MAKKKRTTKKSGGMMGGLNASTAFTAVAGLLVGLVIGVPVLLALFSEGGAFNDLTALPTSGALADNQYSGILSAIILLIPLIVVAFFAFRFLSGQGMSLGSLGGGKKSTRRGGKAKARLSPRAQMNKRIRAGRPSKSDIALAQRILQAGGPAPPAV